MPATTARNPLSGCWGHPSAQRTSVPPITALLGPEPHLPPPSWIRKGKGPNHGGGSGGGWDRVPSGSHMAAVLEPSRHLQLQLPDTSPARRQGISVRLSAGTASVGVVLAHMRASPHPFPGPHPRSLAWARGTLFRGSSSLGC